MRKRLAAVLFLMLLIPAGVAFAGGNEVSFTVGPQFVSGSHYDFGHAGAIQAAYAGRIINAEAAQLYIELPLTWALKNDRSFSPAALRDHYTALFVTPGIKVKLLPQLPISPYGVLGGGFARFRNSDTEQTSNENVIDYGIGADWKVAPLVALRAEWRDFNSGVPRLGFPNPGSRQHNHVVTFGVALHF